MAGQPIVESPSAQRALARAGVALALALFLTVGSFGLYQYLRNFWLYRGFPPPADPAFVKTKGTLETIGVPSAALGWRTQQVLVYLPPGYAAHPLRRYPVFYLLHGTPGRPTAFLLTVRMGVVEDIVTARHRGQPLILVMPHGSTGTFTDTEWANGYRPNQNWETFMARDVVRAIDAQYRTIPTRAGRAIGGLSEGGYAALNIGLHHPNEFSVLESWSGYQRADHLKSIFGGSAARLAWNSPLARLPAVAGTLRRRGTYVWLYWGTTDRLRTQNELFVAALARAGIPHRGLVLRGGHNWSLWRGNAASAYIVAAAHLAHG